MNKYVVLGASIFYVSLLAAAGFLGHRMGVSGVERDWEKEKRLTATAQLEESDSALERTRELAEAATDQHRKDLEAAVRASEERQAARVAQAVRQGVLEAATRQGAYVAPECVLDDETYDLIQEQLQ